MKCVGVIIYGGKRRFQTQNLIFFEILPISRGGNRIVMMRALVKMENLLSPEIETAVTQKFACRLNYHSLPVPNLIMIGIS